MAAAAALVAFATHPVELALDRSETIRDDPTIRRVCVRARVHVLSARLGLARRGVLRCDAMRRIFTHGREAPCGTDLDRGIDRAIATVGANAPGLGLGLRLARRRGTDRDRDDDENAGVEEV